MKMNSWLVLISGALLSTLALAQQVAKPPAETPAPALAPTNAPAATDTNTAAAKAPAKKAAAKKSEKKSAPKKKEAVAPLKTVPLTSGPAMVIASNVNIRGQAKLNSEVIGRLQKGQTVTVIEEVTLKKSGPDEPSAWAEIVLPANTHAWVHSSFIEPTNKTVIPKKLKLRGGPGEEYSILGIIKRGDAVKEVGTKGDWTQIEPPPEGYAFVAAQYLQQPVPSTPVEPPPTPTTVAEAQPVAPPPTEPPAVTNEPAPPAAEQAATEPPKTDEPPPRRIVQREGLVRGTVSIQAPTRIALISPDTGKTINYLHSDAVNLDLARYNALHIIVTGEEGLDERRKNTPVITIQKIQVLE
ncbi:MAG: hypothetical protein DME25_08935 [Verrucomicrobia bacterium]|nr:MAG: hypothetical protein DME25_08935 [Verrucomicrobiota bacterium]